MFKTILGHSCLCPPVFSWVFPAAEDRALACLKTKTFKHCGMPCDVVPIGTSSHSQSRAAFSHAIFFVIFALSPPFLFKEGVRAGSGTHNGNQLPALLPE
jgi:hypothetical protein